MGYFAALLNKLFGGVVAAAMLKIGLTPNAGHPIPTYVAGEVLVILILIVGALVLRSRLSVERPGKFQMAMEVVAEFSRTMSEDLLGPQGRQYVALVGTLGLFIILCNLMGLIPTVESPTAHGPVPLGCAVLVFLHYNYQGIRHHGVLGYLKHLCGPMMALAILMFPVEVFSNVLRLLSLSVRLWANMLVGGMLESIFTKLIPIALPAVFMALHAFESLLQAYIFMILPLLYISLAVAEEH
ncbi:MAG TPA: F0F1 ATP synthase subunit A [Terriglobia bacterium]|nr:F0F1 ATP synthase subunit A [Terriglobia bacterium]